MGGGGRQTSHSLFIEKITWFLLTGGQKKSRNKWELGKQTLIPRQTCFVHVFKPECFKHFFTSMFRAFFVVGIPLH